MQSPVQITFRHMTSSPAIDAHVRERAEKLERYSSAIISCHVVIDAPPKHSQHGKSFHIGLDVAVPGKTIDASHTHEGDPGGQDMYKAIDHAFGEVERELKEHTRKLRSA